MIVPYIMGGLGNACFQIAAAYALAIRTENQFAINYNLAHNFAGFDGRPAQKYRDNFFQNIPSTDLNSEFVLKERGFAYEPLTTNHPDLIIQGFFQSSKYFTDCFSQVKSLFHFRDDLRQSVEKSLLPLREDGKKLVGIHFRGNDYLRMPNFFYRCRRQYYLNALEALGDLNDTELIVFTDDPAGYYREVNLPKARLFRFEHSHAELFDLYGLSQCDQVIMSNSTFAWWAVFFNAKVEKVIVPEEWFGCKGPRDYQDIYEPGWLKVKNPT